jgi:hypothetical protein
MEEETDWIQISRSDQRSYIKIETRKLKREATCFIEILRCAWGHPAHATRQLCTEA